MSTHYFLLMQFLPILQKKGILSLPIPIMSPFNMEGEKYATPLISSFGYFYLDAKEDVGACFTIKPDGIIK